MTFQGADSENYYIQRKQPRSTKKTKFMEHEPRIHLVGNKKVDKNTAKITRSCRNIDPSSVIDEFDSLEYTIFEKKKR